MIGEGLILSQTLFLLFFGLEMRERSGTHEQRAPEGQQPGFSRLGAVGGGLFRFE